MIFALFLLICSILFLFFAIKMVRPFEQGVIEELGKYKKTVEPGLRIVIPVIQTLTKIDMRESVIDVPPQQVITKDNVAVNVDAVIYYEPTEPKSLLYNVENFRIAIIKLAQTNLRNVIGDQSLDDALTSRDIINETLRQSLDEVTDKWGVKVVRVELQKIDPPEDVIASMHKQMEAERLRRATVTEAEGQKRATILKAEGQKEAAITQAEGQKESTILEAEGQKRATELAAEAEKTRIREEGIGEAQALEAIKRVEPNAETLQVRYFEALEKIGEGESTKIFIPNELASISSAMSVITDSK